MNNPKLIWGGILIAIVIALGGWAYPHTQQAAPAPKVGGVANYDNLQLSKIGTSTLSQVGCVQAYATSTLTPIVFTFNAQGTTTLITAFGTVANGMVTWNFGTCGSPVGL